MFTLLNELNECITKNEKYQSFIKSKQLLEKEEIHELLNKYQDITHEYFRMKQYEKYTDISSIKNEYFHMKSKVSNNKDIQEYYRNYYELNELLEEITTIIFDGISEELFNDRYLL